MKIIPLNQTDARSLKADVRLTFIVGLVLCALIILIVGLVPGVMYLLGKKTAYGYARRELYISGLLLLCYLALSWRNIFKLVDLMRGKKISLSTQNYEVKKRNDDSLVYINDHPKQKFTVYQDITPLIDLQKPLLFEYSPTSKTALFISHDSNNFIES